MNKSIYVIFVIFSLLFITCSPENEVETVRIGVCSDVHLPTMHDAEKRITSFIDSMKIAKPDFIIELGDFGIPTEEYAPYFSIWNSFPGPKYHVIGNHEMDGGTSLEEALAYRKMKSSYYSFLQNGFKFIVLDGNDKEFAEQKGYKSYIGNEQLDWLRKELEAAAIPIVIFSHQGIGTDPEIPGERYSIGNSEDVRKIFNDHNKVHKSSRIICCFNGHTHNDYAEEINDIWYITINSMSYKWLGEEYEHIRYSEEVDKEYKWIKFTAPYKEPLYTIVEISTKGYIKMSGKKSEYVGPSPWELGYPEHLRKYVKPQITERLMKFPTE
ncbi:MAG: metallophosphoesterase [Bacteroidales bacterium]|nr:metallophosphoesterase [Bacteroidales bacterium]